MQAEGGDPSDPVRGSGTGCGRCRAPAFSKQFLPYRQRKPVPAAGRAPPGRLSAVGVRCRRRWWSPTTSTRFLAAEQLREAGILLVPPLLEPAGRNTAPALTLAALVIPGSGRRPGAAGHPGGPDHRRRIARLHASRHCRGAGAGAVVIFGVVPDLTQVRLRLHPSDAERCCERIASAGAAGGAFFEKPDAAAQSYLDAGSLLEFRHVRSQGLGRLQALAQLQCPAVKQATRAAGTRARTTPPGHALDAAFMRPGQAEFSIAGISIDHAVMEPLAARGPAAAGLPALRWCRWTLAGATSAPQDAVWQTLPKDGDGNAPLGDVLTTGNQGNLGTHASNRLVCLVGVRDLIVVETPDAVLVADAPAGT